MSYSAKRKEKTKTFPTQDSGSQVIMVQDIVLATSQGGNKWEKMGNAVPWH